MTVPISVVVACGGGEEMLRGCLESLEPQRGAAEVIAVGAWGDEARARLAGRFPWARLLEAHPEESVFRRRARGLEASGGALLVLLEDHCRPPAGWLAALTRGDQAAVGGPLSAESPRSLRSFALFLVEYSALLPPLPDRDATLLAVNAAYTRAVLFAVADRWRDGFYDNEVHDALRASGHPVCPARDAVVESRLDLPAAAACRHLHSGGRRYGGYAAHRVARVLAAPLLPVLLLGRIAFRVAGRRPGWLPRTVLAGPWLLVFLAAWSAGEGLGALSGRG